MNQEQERKFYEMFEHVVETKTVVLGLSDRLSQHEEEDVAAHKRISDLESVRVRYVAHRTIIRTIIAYGATFTTGIVIPIIIWLWN